MSSKPFAVPGKHFTNGAILGANALTMVSVGRFPNEHLFKNCVCWYRVGS